MDILNNLSDCLMNLSYPAHFKSLEGSPSCTCQGSRKVTLCVATSLRKCHTSMGFWHQLQRVTWPQWKSSPDGTGTVLGLQANRFLTAKMYHFCSDQQRKTLLCEQRWLTASTEVMKTLKYVSNIVMHFDWESHLLIWVWRM